MLVPVGLLAILTLGAILIDLSLAFAGRREAINAASAAANDAIGASIDRGAFASSGTIAIDEATLIDYAQSALDRRDNRIVKDLTVTEIEIDPDEHDVEITVEGFVETIFAKALPGGSDRIHVRASSSATIGER